VTQNILVVVIGESIESNRRPVALAHYVGHQRVRVFNVQPRKVNDCPTDDEQVTLLTPLDYCNIVRNMSLHDTRRTNFVLSELLIWTKHLQYALQRMYEVSNEIDEE